MVSAGWGGLGALAAVGQRELPGQLGEARAGWGVTVATVGLVEQAESVAQEALHRLLDFLRGLTVPVGTEEWEVLPVLPGMVGSAELVPLRVQMAARAGSAVKLVQVVWVGLEVLGLEQPRVGRTAPLAPRFQ